MIEAGRPCLELAQQLHAVEKAVANAKRALIHDHIDHCLEHAADGPAPRRVAPSRNSRKSPSTCEL
ncbi:metal-sensing transcriptional repressor [Paeniroseomonas aquatica]